MNREGSCWRGGQVMNHEGAVVGSTGVMIHDLTPPYLGVNHDSALRGPGPRHDS